MISGFQYVKEKLKNISKMPGCYLMKDHDGIIFYIGKAKNLHARLKSYFLGTDTRVFVQFLEAILADIEIIVLNNDIEALILERELIKKHQPRFNIMLKDDKNYILLKLKPAKETGKRAAVYPRLEIVRKTQKDGAKYFGPYPSAKSLRATFEFINKYFLLRTCSDKVIDNRHRPCIEHQIGRCPAPCVYEVKNYKEELGDVTLFLGGNQKDTINRLSQKMWDLAQNEQFEAATKVREQIDAIKLSLTKQAVSNLNKKGNQDVIGIADHASSFELCRVSIKNGQLQKSDNYTFDERPFPKKEILRSFLHQIYQEASEIPNEIIIPLDIMSELSGLKSILENSSGHKIKIIHPKKGQLISLLNIANNNAKVALDERMNQIKANNLSLDALKETLGLSLSPKHIECIDISLISGSDPVGSSVAFIDGVPDKKLYRCYHIKTVSGMDDFSMIKEVVHRRLKRAIAEEKYPDLLLIDGGKGQLNAAISAISELNILISQQGFYVAGIAKKRALKDPNSIKVEHSDERLFVPKKDLPIILKAHTFERYLVERIRDEAHRFALKAHHKRRDKRTISSELLGIKGISKSFSLILLKHFGSLKNIKEASLEEISNVPKIGLKRAEIIYNYFREQKV